MTVVSAQGSSFEVAVDLPLSTGVKLTIDLAFSLIEQNMYFLSDLRWKLQNRLAIYLGSLGTSKTDRFDQDAKLLHDILSSEARLDASHEVLDEMRR
jgi:hypothetical protein